MGFFKELFGSGSEGVKSSNKKENKNVKAIPWLALTTVSQLDEIVKRSETKTQVIFKHSTSCGISRMVMNMFKSNYDLPKAQIDLYYLDLLVYREVSDEAGYLFQVMHQSPQLLVIRSGIVVAHASHGAISKIDLHKYL